MRYLVNFLFVSFSLAIFSGCSMFKSNENVNYFSISSPDFSARKNEVLKKDFNIQVIPFSSNETYGSKMVFSQASNSIFFDSYNCWAQKPSTIMTNYFTLFLGEMITSEVNNVKIYTLSGTILNFSCNMETKKTNLALKLVLTDDTGKIVLSKIYKDNSDLSKLSASAFAEAMSESAENIVFKFLNNLKSIH